MPSSSIDTLGDCAVLARALAAMLGAELIETHISWVVLAGDTAYKIKKPVRLPFVDYSTLAARRHFCEEELRLNRRLAPSVYLGVSAITGTLQRPEFDGDAEAIEYAVRMRRFPAGALFSERVEAGVLRPADVDALAELLAAFHERAPQAPAGSSFGTSERRRAAALLALEGARSPASEAGHARLRQWIQAQAAALEPLWESRLHNGHIRECHGDLHLDNIVVTGDGVAAFDGIEFDPALRWIDVLDDIAFVVMDFVARGRRDFAMRFLNGWLDRTGDHAALPALHFSMVYRALVRAQVTGLRGEPANARRYLDAALASLAPPAARLVITHGLPGSGKTFQSQHWLEREGAIRLRSDVERKRLFGLDMLEDSKAAGIDLYGAQANARTYAHLLATARALLHAGFSVVIDAAFLRRAERDEARALARSLGLPFSILHCEAPLDTLRERLLARSGDASEADAAVLDQLRASDEPLDSDELASMVGWTGAAKPA